MSIKRCNYNHFYDEDNSPQCPNRSENLTLNEIPERFQKLGVITFLGKGSTSHVFKLSGEKEYAIKVIRCGADESKYQNALYELRIMERLKGESHVVQLCDYEIVDTSGEKNIYILEEYHRTMSDYLSSRSFCAAELLVLIKGICNSLLACKNLNVLHLDVQPKNIFVDNLSCVLLGDFSHSLFTDDAQTNDNSRGTLAYMAPEVYQNGRCSEQSDIYSLGLILFSLFNNKVLPFMESDTGEVSIYKRLAGAKLPEIVLLDAELQKDLNHIICRACSYVSANRYANLIEFKYDLIRLIKSVRVHPERNIQIYTKPESPDKYTLPVIYVLQTSGALTVKAINELNCIVQESLEKIKNQVTSKEVEIRISTLLFGDRIGWLSLNECADRYHINQITIEESGDFPNLSPALVELNRKLTKGGNDAILTERCFSPIIIYVSNGLLSDDFESAAMELKHNRWYKRSRKICFLVGDESDIKNLSILTGSTESILKFDDLHLFHRIIHLASISKNSLGNYFDADSVATSVILDTISTTPAYPNNDLDSFDWDDDDWDCDEDGSATVSISGVLHVAMEHPKRPAELRADPRPTIDSSGHTIASMVTSNNGNVIDSNDRVVVPGGKHAGGYIRRCRVCDNSIVGDMNYCPYCGCRVLINRPNVDIKKVSFSALAPKELMRGEYSIINIVMYEESSRSIIDTMIDEMGSSTQESRSGIHNVSEDSLIKVVLSSDDIEIVDHEETGVWQGNYLIFPFSILLPEQYKKRQLLFVASVFINDVIACKLKFIVKCSSISHQKIVVSREDIFSAFVSYASQDRNRVAAIIQGMKKVRPDMDIFFDVESLRSGDDWGKSLYQEIEKRDILYLCWSHFARKSKWVDAEWRYAFKLKGAEYIEPIPIESPDICPPPIELNHKHFNDNLLYIINAPKNLEHTQNDTHEVTEADIPDDCDDW